MIIASDGSIVHGPNATSESASHQASGSASHLVFRALPSVDALLKHDHVQALVSEYGHSLVVQQLRELLAELRKKAQDGDLEATELAQRDLTTTLADRCQCRVANRMRRVLNLTGTVIHTNLGRAVLADAAIEHVATVMRMSNNLEFDLDSGDRGDRDSIVESLLCELTGAEAATVVNNNAAAVLLVIAALARGREVIVSRGELVEIGGAFRMPDVMASAGATMIEVGTTNRTHLSDYVRAISENTALLMKVHTSNYAITGFTSAVSENDLSAIAMKHGIPLVTDLGSGSLIPLEHYGLPHEPTPQEMIKAGCDVVTFSGDKLLGGPQAGLIVGKKDAITQIRKFPMKRALRVSKLPLAALEATLRLYLKPEHLTRDLPTLRHLTRSQEEVRRVAASLLDPMRSAVSPQFSVDLVETRSQIGSGSLPVDRIASTALAIRVHTPDQKKKSRTSGASIAALAIAFRALSVPVIGRMQDNCLLFDCRCLDEPDVFLRQLPELVNALQAASRTSA